MHYLKIFYNLSGPDEGSPIPLDVVNHGEQFGLKGVNFWPQLSHRQVIDAIDSLKKKYKQDFDRVKNNIFPFNFFPPLPQHFKKFPN